MFFVKLPKYDSSVGERYVASIYASSACYFLTASIYSLMFMSVFVISLTRFIAFFYPMLYKYIFNQYHRKIIISSMLIISISIGSGTLFFESRYEYKSDTDSYVASYLNPQNVNIYQAVYSILFFGCLILISLVFNIMCVLKFIKKSEYGMGVDGKLEKAMVIHSSCSLAFLSIMEVYYIGRVLGGFMGLDGVVSIAMANLTWITDIVTFGDLIIMLTTNTRLRTFLIEAFFKRIFCFCCKRSKVAPVPHNIFQTRRAGENSLA
uniref:Serpentine receptor class gamma n=1 Tax=Rhabditophanes sp. KR3021 TaxID=114890 RepID=A0AC35U779_9BILA